MRGADTFTESLFTMSQLDDFGKRSMIPVRPLKRPAGQACILIFVSGLFLAFTLVRRKVTGSNDGNNYYHLFEELRSGCPGKTARNDCAQAANIAMAFADLTASRTTPLWLLQQRR